MWIWTSSVALFLFKLNELSGSNYVFNIFFINILSFILPILYTSNQKFYGLLIIHAQVFCSVDALK